MEDKTKKSREYYNAISKSYSDLYHNEQIKKINLVKNYLPNKGNILDLGAGDGVLNQFLNMKNLNLISVDISEELLKKNSNKNENKKILDIHNLSIFENNYFDYIISFTVIQDVFDFEKVILEIKRVLKKDGTLIISFLKMIPKKSQNIKKELENNFKIIKFIEEEKDFIFVLIPK
jgi:ubiquinone/menaquinone biosynthesis C-methylase UbiE